METASAYRLRDRYFVHPNKRTTTGLWIAQPEFLSLPLSSSAEHLGSAVLKSLAQSQGVLPHPVVWTGLSKPRLAAAGVRSERAFMESALLVNVTRDKELVLEPSHNGGATGEKRGFGPLTNKSATVPSNPTPEQLGSALLAAFSVCTNAA